MHKEKTTTSIDVVALDSNSNLALENARDKRLDKRENLIKCEKYSGYETTKKHWKMLEIRAEQR